MLFSTGRVRIFSPRIVMTAMTASTGYNEPLGNKKAGNKKAGSKKAGSSRLFQELMTR
jgi:hypothetical protein